MNENFATKSDLKELELSLLSSFKGLESQFGVLKSEFGGLRSEFEGLKFDFRELKSDFNGIEARIGAKFESSLKELDYRLTIKLAGMITIGVGLLTAMIKLMQMIR